MEIRVALELDLLTLINLGKSYVDEQDRWAALSFDPDRALYFAALAIEDPNQQIFMATEGRDILGFMWVGLTSPIWSSDLTAYDIFLYVHPDHRGAKVAVELVGAFEAWAKACGAIAIHTGANSGVFKDKPAEALYKHMGYVPGGFNFYKEL